MLIQLNLIKVGWRLQIFQYETDIVKFSKKFPNYPIGEVKTHEI